MIKYQIDFRSLYSKGLPKNNEDFLVVLVCGSQGTGKNYFCFYKEEQILRDVITNVHSYKNDKVGVEYFTKLWEIYTNFEKNKLFIIDECSKKFPKDSKIDKDFYGWLQQSRKTNRYVFLIFQEYYMVPQWLRGVANLVYVTRKIPFLPLQSTTLGVPVLDKETFEWGIKELSVCIYKRNEKIGSMYDTYEVIGQL